MGLGEERKEKRRDTSAHPIGDRFLYEPASLFRSISARAKQKKGGGRWKERGGAVRPLLLRPRVEENGDTLANLKRNDRPTYPVCEMPGSFCEAPDESQNLETSAHSHSP